MMAFSIFSIIFVPPADRIHYWGIIERVIIFMLISLLNLILKSILLYYHMG